MSQKDPTPSTDFPIIIDLHLNPDTAAKDKFYFLPSFQAPLTRGEVVCLAVAMLDLEGRWKCRRLHSSGWTNNLPFVLGHCDSKAAARKCSSKTRINKVCGGNQTVLVKAARSASGMFHPGQMMNARDGQRLTLTLTLDLGLEQGGVTRGLVLTQRS